MAICQTEFASHLEDNSRYSGRTELYRVVTHSRRNFLLIFCHYLTFSLKLVKFAPQVLEILIFSQVLVYFL